MWLSFTHKKLGSCKSLLALQRVFFRSDVAMLRQRNATVQTKQGQAYQGHDLHNRIMREYDMTICLSSGPKQLEDSQGIQRVRGSFRVLSIIEARSGEHWISKS
jgi:hypothetical protein